MPHHTFEIRQPPLHPSGASSEAVGWSLVALMLGVSFALIGLLFMTA